MVASGRCASVAPARVVRSWRLDGTAAPAAAVGVLRGRWYELPEGAALERYSLFYVGGDSPALANLLMTHSRLPVRSQAGNASADRAILFDPQHRLFSSFLQR